MQFSDTTTKQGIIQDCESILFGDNYGQISGDSNLLATFVRNSNRALDKATTLIFDADGRWQWDDTNNTDYPIATTNLVAGQQDYRFNVSHLRIHEVQVKSGDSWIKLVSLDPRDYRRPLDEIFGSGTPTHYDKLADALFLYPNPNYDLSDGLKVFFQREASYFTASDTTKEPGFAKNFHRFISLWACYDYAFAKQLPITKVLRDEIQVMTTELQDFYSTRSKDEHITLKVRRGNFK